VTNYIEVGSENMQLGWIDFSKEDRQKPFIRVFQYISTENIFYEVVGHRNFRMYEYILRE